MKLYVDNVPDNCNHCIYRQDMSRHWDLDDYCFLNKKSTNRIIMDKDYPFRRIGGKRYKVTLNDNYCAECEYMKKYDYGKKIYYCDHEDRIDDMGKLSTGELPEGSPEWCPLKEKMT